MTSPTRNAASSGALIGCLMLFIVGGSACAVRWSDEEKASLQDLRRVPGMAPPDLSNRFADDEEAARLGHRLFFDERLSANGEVACATCHLPERQFQDGVALAKGVGTTNRRTMPLAGVDASSWFFWDGRKDSLWSQALGPLESEVEHGGDRLQYAHLIATHYRDDYEKIFGPLPDLSGLPEHATPNGSPELWDVWLTIPPSRQDEINRVFANIGKAIAAYERKLQPGDARFDRYVDAVIADDAQGAADILSRDEVAGLRLFIGKAQCTQCHNGPQLTNHDFANTGVAAAPGLPEDLGRLSGARELLQDEFNCLGPYSDASPRECRELVALQVDAHTTRQFKVPSLRNVAERAPFMHAGQLTTLEQVIDHYDRAPPSPAGESELRPLELSAHEMKQLVQFLATLSAPLEADAVWLHPPSNAD